jgi:hypothetical protein
LQPRFHLEIGLVRLVHAGRLLPIEEALAGLGGGGNRTRPAPPPTQAPPPAASARRASAPPEPRRSAPEPPTIPGETRPSTPAAPPDPGAGPPASARRASAPPESRRSAPEPPAIPETRPSTSAAPPEPGAGPADWRKELHSALMDLGLTFTADAVENSRVVEANGELQFTTTKPYKLALREDDLRKAMARVSPRPLRIKVAVGDSVENAPPIQGASSTKEDDATSRALANPEVQHFREVFGGEIRKIRNLKES